MSSGYDVAVIGGGSPGCRCAGALAKGGLRVARVENVEAAAVPISPVLYSRQGIADTRVGRQIR